MPGIEKRGFNPFGKKTELGAALRVTIYFPFDRFQVFAKFSRAKFISARTRLASFAVFFESDGKPTLMPSSQFLKTTAHCAKTAWARQGVGVDVAMLAAGHASVQMHQAYVHLQREDVAKAFGIPHDVPTESASKSARNVSA